MCHLWWTMSRTIQLWEVISLLVDVLLKHSMKTAGSLPVHMLWCVVFPRMSSPSSIFFPNLFFSYFVLSSTYFHIEHLSLSIFFAVSKMEVMLAFTQCKVQHIIMSIFLQVPFWSPTFFSWSLRGCPCSTWSLPWASITGKGQLQFGKYALSLKVNTNTHSHACEPACLQPLFDLLNCTT